MWIVMKCDAMSYQGGHLHKEPGRKYILRWNLLWKSCKKNPCLGVLYGREKGRENIICWLSASPDSHWPKFTPGLNSPPVLLGDITWLFKKPDPMPHELTHFIQVPEVETWRGGNKPWCLRCANYAGLNLVSSSEILVRCQQIGDGGGRIGNTSKVFGKKEAIKGIWEGTQSLSSMDS